MSIPIRITSVVLAALSISVLPYSPASASPGFVHKFAESVKGDYTPPAPIKVRDKWALLIGVDKFQDPAVAPNKDAANNVRALQAVLSNPAIGKFAPDHVKVLSGEHATASGITHVLEDWLVKKALPDDLILIYISSVVNKGGDGDPVAFSFDTLGSESELCGIDLKDLLAQVRRRTQSKYVLCVLDTSPAPRSEGTDLKALARTGVAILSATNGEQKSINDPAVHSSVFVHRLGEAVALEGGNLTLQQVFEYLEEQVKADAEASAKAEQTPVLALAGDPTITQVAVGAAAKAAAPRTSFAIGHPLDRLAIDHPGVIPPHASTVAQQTTGAAGHHTPAPKAKPVAKDHDDDDDDEPHKDVDFGSYMAKMKQDIQKHWTPPKGLENRRIVAVFTIMKDGRIVDSHIVEGTGMDDIDQSALNALKASSPLDPLPKGSPASVDIKYKFDWQVKRD
jgi:TonB family protein